MTNQTKEATFEFSPDSQEVATQAELDALVWGSLINHVHREEGRGAHDSAVWDAYENGRLTAEQRNELRLRPDIDFITLEVGSTSLIGVRQSSPSTA